MNSKNIAHWANASISSNQSFRRDWAKRVKDRAVSSKDASYVRTTKAKDKVESVVQSRPTTPNVKDKKTMFSSRLQNIAQGNWNNNRT